MNLQDLLGRAEARVLAAHANVAGLVARPWAEQRQRVTTDRDLQTREVVDLLMSLARETTRSDRVAAMQFAALAVLAAEQARDDRWAGEVLSLAWATLGNVHRAAGDLSRSATAFSFSRRYLSRAPDPLTRAEVLKLHASDYEHRGRFKPALGLLERALEITRRFAVRHLIGETLVRKGCVLASAGSYLQAIDVLCEALEDIEPMRDPYLTMSAVHALTLSLGVAGAPDLALATASRFAPLYEKHLGSVEVLRLNWLEATLLDSCGLSEAAEGKLTLVVEGFSAISSPLDVALASVELAGLMARRGAWREAEAAAGRGWLLCSTMGVERDQLAALLVIREAAARRQVDAELTTQLRDALATRLAPRPDRGVSRRDR